MPTQEFRIVLDGDSSGLVQALKQAGVQVDLVEGKAAKSKRTLDSMSSSFLKIGSVWTGAVIAGAGYMAKVASETEQLNLSFEVLLKSGDAAKKMMKDLQQFANVTPFELSEVATATKSLLAFGVAAKDVPRYLKTAGDAASGMGVPFEQAARVLGRVKQGMVSMDEIIQIGLTKDDMTKWGAKFSKAGEAISDKAVLAEAALKALEERFGGMMQKQAESLAGRISTLGDAFKQLITDPQGKGIGDAIARELNTPIKDLSETFNRWKESGVTEDMGEAIGELARDGGKAITELMTAVTKMIGVWNEANEVTKQLGFDLNKMALAGGVFLMAAGAIGKIATAWNAVKTAAWGAAAAQTAAGAAGTKAAAGGVAAFSKGILPAIIALGGYELYQNWQKMGPALEETSPLLMEGSMKMRKPPVGGASDARPLIEQIRGVQAFAGECQLNINNAVEAATGNRPTTGESANDAKGNALASGAARVYKGQALNEGDKLYLRGGKYGHTVLYIGNGEVLDSSPGGTPIGNGWYLRPVSAYKGRIAAVEATGFRIGGKAAGDMSGPEDMMRGSYTGKMLAEAGIAGASGDLNNQAYFTGRALAGVQADMGDLSKLGLGPQSAQMLELRRQEVDINKQLLAIEAQRLALLTGGTSSSVMAIGGYGATLGLMNQSALLGGAGRMAALAAVGSGFAPTRDTWSSRGLPATWMSGAALMPASVSSTFLPAFAMPYDRPADPFAFYAGGAPTSWGGKAGSITSANDLIAGAGIGGGGLTGFQKVSQGFGALSSLLGGTGGGVMGGIGAGIQSWGLGESLFSTLGIGGSLGGPVGLLLGGLGGLFEGIFGSSGPSVKEQLEKIERNTRPLGKVFDVRWASTPSSLMPAGLAYAGASRGAF